MPGVGEAHRGAIFAASRAFPSRPGLVEEYRADAGRSWRLPRRPPRSPARCPSRGARRPCSAASSRSAAKCGRLASGSSANGGIVISPATRTGQRSRKPGSSSGRDAGLALLARDVDLDQHLGLRRAVALELRAAPSPTRRSGSARRAAGSGLTLRLWSWPMKCQRKRVGPGRGLGLELLRAVLAEQRDAGLGEHAEVLDVDVLDRGEQLDVAGIAARARARRRRSPRARGRRSRARAPASSARHTTPAWRPVTPPSRRWEKNSVVAAHRAQAGVVDRRRRRPRASAWRGDRGEVEVALADARARDVRERARGPPRRPRSSSRARSGRARR